MAVRQIPPNEVWFIDNMTGNPWLKIARTLPSTMDNPDSEKREWGIITVTDADGVARELRDSSDEYQYFDPILKEYEGRWSKER